MARVRDWHSKQGLCSRDSSIEQAGGVDGGAATPSGLNLHLMIEAKPQARRRVRVRIEKCDESRNGVLSRTCNLAFWLYSPRWNPQGKQGINQRRLMTAG